MLRKVTVEDSQLDWKKQFEEEARRLKDFFWKESSLFIHHIGSTSIEGLAAKPIIDILIEVPDINKVDDQTSMMERQLGIKAKGENGIPGRRYFQRLDENGVHLTHLHIYPIGHPDIERHLVFRDYLREHPDRAKDYGDLKRELAVKYPFDIASYIDGKDALVKEIEEEALKWKKSGAE
ncbi:GrpB family protein [Falsibacillus pallidus]|uniref:GrpB family protein n=1 Tax=Falsibacillus pallidus TaxID=493781 RepID=UPI003D99C4B3